MDYLERYHDWLEHAPLNAEEHAALAAMREDADALKSAFGAELAFGTAGIRGIMGLGTNRLNEFTVRRTAQGLAAWLTGTDLPVREVAARLGYAGEIGIIRLFRKYEGTTPGDYRAQHK